MPITIVDEAEVFRIAAGLDLTALADAAFLAISAGEVIAPPRLTTRVSDAGYLGVMPGALPAGQPFGAKLVSFFPENGARSLPAIQGFILLFDPDTATPRALVDAGSVTLLRTAAASASATRLLAAPAASSLGLIGAGAQARTHLDAIAKVRLLDRVLVWSRSADAARRFATAEGARTGLRIEATIDPRAAAACAIVCTVTSSATPVLLGDWIAPGAHVNLVGAHSPMTREIDGRGIARARVFVDSRSGAAVEAGDLLLAVAEGAIDASHVKGEIGQVLCGTVEGRTSSAQLTVFKSLGHVAQDLVAATEIVAAAGSPSR